MKPMKIITLLALTAGTITAQWWEGPYQLTADSGADVKPSVCREWVVPNMTCMVWQTNRHGNWDVYSKFCNYLQGNGWMNEIPVTLSPVDDINPAVACVNDVHDSPSYWCVWERVESPVLHTIRAAFYTWRDQWRDTAVIVQVPLHPGQTANPSVIVMKGATRDTAWVVWHGNDTGGHYIGYAYHDGTAWSSPGIAYATSQPLLGIRIGRGTPPRQNQPYCPLLVWQQAGDIYYCEYLNGAWTAPVAVAPSTAYDCNPEVVSSNLLLGTRPCIVWQSTRGGDTAIYAAALDSITYARRLCNPPPCGSNITPAAVAAAFPVIDQYEFLTVWTSDRNGNPDIYSSAPLGGISDIAVNQDPALDSLPVITALGVTEVWCCWQSNRSGNWDIWGSFIYASGMHEQHQPGTGAAIEILPSPCRDRAVIRLSSLTKGQPVRVEIHDRAGCLVRRFTGSAPFIWDCTDNTGQRVADGCYFVTLKTGSAPVRNCLVVRR